MVSLRAEPRMDPVPGGCVHLWARRVDSQGHPIYCCTKCPATVDFSVAREEHERLTNHAQQPSTC